MAAPSPIGAVNATSFSNANPTALTITNGWSAGSSIILAFSQSTSTLRTVSSIVASNGDTFTLEAIVNSGSSVGMAAIYKCEVATAMAAGGTVTINWNANATGSMWVQEFSAFTSASLTDTATESVASLSHTTAATGVTTSGDVLIIAAGQLSGTAVSTVAGTNYTKLSGSTTSHLQYRASATGLTTEIPTWTHTTVNRTARGVTAAFYAAGGGGGRTTKNTRSWPLGVGAGMGWRMPA